MSKGQITMSATILVAMIGLAGSFITARATANDAIKDKLADTNTNVAVLQKSDETQNTSISEMKDNIEYIRRSMEEINKKLGVIIK